MFSNACPKRPGIRRWKPWPALIMLFVVMLTSCGNPQNHGQDKELVIFHAGSLSKPIKEIIDVFLEENSGYEIRTEAAGSVECARKITELHKPCDIILTSDYSVIRNMLIPGYASWYIKFATNEMSIAYTDESRLGDYIDQNNWPGILLSDEVIYGRADPDLDPCGYRTLLTYELAEKYYDRKGLARELAGKDQQFIRPKEVDLLALLEVKSLDYIFIYRSVAQQHGLKYMLLPDEINLKDPALDSLYASVSVEITGMQKDEKVTIKGESMVYGISILNDAPNPALAEKFTAFFLSRGKGMKIMEQNGQPSIVPSFTEYYEKLPGKLKIYALK